MRHPLRLAAAVALALASIAAAVSPAVAARSPHAAEEEQEAKLKPVAPVTDAEQERETRPEILGRDTIISSADEARVAVWLKEFGATYRTVRNGNRTTIVATAATGLKFLVMFYGCEGGDGCRVIVLRALFHPSIKAEPEAINLFNQTFVFGKAFVDDDGAINCELPINLTAGVTEGNALHHFVLFQEVVRSMMQLLQGIQSES